MNNKTILAIAIGSALLVGAGGGYWLAATPQQSSAMNDPAADNKPLFYRNPMNPAITSPVPAQDEMGMDYIPVYAEGHEPKERKPLFYRNPMNPAITSPVPAQDEMGMDYIPVYAEDDAPQERKLLFYRNPMNPAITSPVPAQDEMGMDYIPVYAEEKTEALPGTVSIDPVMVQDIGVRIQPVQRGTLSRSIRTSGRVAVDEERLLRLHPKYEGWVEKLFVTNTGDAVKKDDMLLSIYSPQLVTSEEEYLLALENAEKLKDSPFADVRQGAQSLLASSEQRLRLLDLPEHQIEQLKQTREVFKGVHIHSPMSGIVMNIGAREGQRIMPNTELYVIADLSRVWVMVDLYEDDMPWVREGDRASLQVAGIPGRTFSGKLTRIYPYLDAKTRTVKARLEFANPGLLLKPDMFGQVEVQAGRKVDALTVPSEAIVRSGTQTQVFVQRAPGRFEPRTVTLGVAANNLTQIISGVEEGEQVVTSSQFLIDSESKLKEATAKMLETMQQPVNDAGAAQ
ncbi:MAG: efflux RND transporter periplasmic adaptor subunit [Pseudomonadota bacterium]